ncbi:4-amino-4-deoxy-L-arabinose transferase-like glycosyltransferase [Pseudomonas alcaliphila]|nr:4-amino-4-deoxy-L-arabinose transferase-like glycosyltransferase [Pseudomonas alcaliphila]
MRGVFSAVGARFFSCPVRATFFFSLLLSLIAVFGVVTIGKDAAFYLDIARQASEEGLLVAQEKFHWPAFILLIAVTHMYLGVSLEVAAYLWSALFIAGTCALLVDMVRGVQPRATWWAVLVVLAMPAFNAFRADILREFGFWFFSILTLWLALRWQRKGGWSLALGVAFSIFAAAAFRLEAVLLFPALILWQLPALFDRGRRSQALQFYSLLMLLALAGVCGLVALVLLLDFPVSRISYFAGLISPWHLVRTFSELSAEFAQEILRKYSWDDAGLILFCGFLATILIKFVGLLGPFSVALLSRSVWRELPVLCRCFSLSSWAAVLYLAVLLMFFVQLQFMNSRYLSFLNLLTVPIAAVAMSVFSKQWPRASRWLVGLAILCAVANVVSFGAKKTHYVEAGHWVAENIEATANVYYVDGRIAYYAGRGYPIPERLDRVIESPQKYQYLVLEADGDEPWLLMLLDQNQLRILERFSNRKRDTVLIIGR